PRRHFNGAVARTPPRQRRYSGFSSPTGLSAGLSAGGSLASSAGFSSGLSAGGSFAPSAWFFSGGGAVFSFLGRFDGSLSPGVIGESPLPSSGGNWKPGVSGGTSNGSLPAGDFLMGFCFSNQARNSVLLFSERRRSPLAAAFPKAESGAAFTTCL